MFGIGKSVLEKFKLRRILDAKRRERIPLQLRRLAGKLQIASIIDGDWEYDLGFAIDALLDGLEVDDLPIEDALRLVALRIEMQREQDAFRED